MIYDEGLNSDFCRFMAGIVKYNYHTTVTNILTSNLFNVTTHDNYYEVKPLFNYDTCESSNPKDHTNNPKVLILQKIGTTQITFRSDNKIIDYSEMKTETTIDNLKYTLYYTYDTITAEPAPNKLTSNGNVTDKNGYYLDCEVITDDS